MDDIFIIQSEKLTIEEKWVEILELIIKEPNELVVFKKDEASMQTFSFIDFEIKVGEEIKVLLVKFELGNLGK